MQDRIPTKPNRYAVYDDAHNFVRYEYHERADEPTQTGDALNKANLLPDDVVSAVEAALGINLGANPQVKDALAAFAYTPTKIAAGSYTGTGTFGSGNKNSLTLDFAPKRISIIHSTGIGFGELIINGSTVYGYSNTNWAGAFLALEGSISGNTVSWYNATDQGSQLNTSTETYLYVAEG